MDAHGDVARGFVEAELYHGSVAIGQGEGRLDAAGRADRTEQMGVVVALVSGLARARPQRLPFCQLERRSSTKDVLSRVACGQHGSR
jgi:hypothetical protein